MNNTLPSDLQEHINKDMLSYYPDLSLLGIPLSTTVGSWATSIADPPVTIANHYTKDAVDELLAGITSELQKLKEEISELKSLPQNKRYFAEKELIEKLLNDGTLLG